MNVRFYIKQVIDELKANIRANGEITEDRFLEELQNEIIEVIKLVQYKSEIDLCSKSIIKQITFDYLLAVKNLNFHPAELANICIALRALSEKRNE